MAGDAFLMLRDRSERQWFTAKFSVFAGAILVVGAVAILVHDRRVSSDRGPIATLAELSRGVRPIEPRLSGGFEWAPRRRTRDGASSTSGLPAAVEAGTLRGDSSPDAGHSAGVAQLLAGRPREALASLAPAAESLNTAAAFSDLAAAYLETANRHDVPELLAEALAAADRALGIDDRHVEALFNRALAIERLGIRDDARAAWERYLAADSTTGWAAEARERRDGLALVPAFLEVLDREYDRVAKDAAAAVPLAQRDPFGARGIVIRDVLGRWGTAELRRDPRDATRHLAVARHFGAAIAQDGGDRMLERAVAAIDKADAAARLRLAAAHVDYRNGLLAFAASKPGQAEPILRRAAAAFEQNGSPMVLPARYFAANTVFEQGRPDEAEREQEQILRSLSADFPAYRAFVLWQLGNCRSARGDWGPAIMALEESAALFDRLGEDEMAAAVYRTVAFVHDRLGDRETSWKHWLVALRGVGRRSDLPLMKALDSIADDAIARRQWHLAASFLTLQAEVSRRRADDMQLAISLFILAAVRARTNDAPGAAATIAEARAVAAGVSDPTYRRLLHIMELRARALVPGVPPAEAAALLTEAVEYQSVQRDRFELPGLLLERARVRRKAGDEAGAASDLEHGIAELERHRQSVPAGELRWGAFHAAEELFAEAIDLALARRSVEAAFSFAERARARSLLDALGHAPVVELMRIPAGTVVVEYATLESRLAIFTADASGLQVATVPIVRDGLVRDVDALARALSGGAANAAAAASASVYRRLITPVESRIAGAGTVVVIPDGTTSAVPFAALTDPSGEYLIARHAIVVAPSAAAFLAASERRSRAVAPRTALVISSTAADDQSALAFAEREGRRVASVYPVATHVVDEIPDLEQVFAAGADPDVVHFAGHAVGDPRGFEPASIILRQEGRDRRMRVAEIARLRLRNTRVVVLAGCSTGRGPRRAAEGVISVAHGFLIAGAPSVIATLWPIEDEASAIFFPRVHQRLAEGMSPAAAVREAQLESARRRDVPMSLWAAVQTIGS